MQETPISISAKAKPEALSDLWWDIQAWASDLGLSGLGVASLDVTQASQHLNRWLALGRHGEMDYMARHAALRAAPQTLVPGSIRAISARLNYWPHAADAWDTLKDPQRAYISRYALGRDYHKLLRKRLQLLADRITERVGRFGYRVFVDSAPVLETELAVNAGLGWRGKHTLTLTRKGSWHFLGEILTDLPLPIESINTPAKEHCGSCTRCLPACPTQAIVAPYEIDARRCISYLTIEHAGEIPEPLREAMGNRIYGCDDCQLVCPWNRFAKASGEPDFNVRNALDRATLAGLFVWSESDFNDRLAGTAIRRIGWERWLRNIAVALGNARRTTLTDDDTRVLNEALLARADHTSALVRQHVTWALNVPRGA